jgi:hypothetical protein
MTKVAIPPTADRLAARAPKHEGVTSEGNKTPAT